MGPYKEKWLCLRKELGEKILDNKTESSERKAAISTILLMDKIEYSIELGIEMENE